MKSKYIKIIALSLTIVLAFTLPVFGKGRPSPPEEPAGVNNLSVPVIFAESIGLKGGVVADATDVDNTGLPRDFMYPETVKMTPEYATVCSIDLDGDKMYDLTDTAVWLQKTDTEWQAEFGLASPDLGNAVPVRIDWGDNLTSVKYYTNSIIRLENVMFLDGALGLNGYEMGWVTGEGITEVWGTTGTAGPAADTTVFSQNARLTVQRLVDNIPTGEPIINASIYEGYALPDSSTDKYSSEVNVGGKLIYGHVFNCRDYGLVAGVYRITFSIDKVGKDLGSSDVQGNVQFVGTPDLNARVITESELGNDYPSSVAVSYIDITIKPAKGGRK